MYNIKSRCYSIKKQSYYVRFIRESNVVKLLYSSETEQVEDFCGEKYRWTV